MARIERYPQQSPQWEIDHIGRPSAGNFHKILTPRTLKPSKSRLPYMYRLVAETLLGEYLPEKPSSDERPLYWMDRGVDMEPQAIAAFERQHNTEVQPIGFVISDDNRLGCSPDGLVVGTGERECVEIKSPAPWTMVQYYLGDEDWAWRYRCQVQGQMIVGGFEACHFFAYHPRMPAKYMLTLPDYEFQGILRQALADFIGDLDRAILKVKELGTFIRLEEVLGSAVGGD